MTRVMAFRGWMARELSGRLLREFHADDDGLYGKLELWQVGGGGLVILQPFLGHGEDEGFDVYVQDTSNTIDGAKAAVLRAAGR